VLEGKGEMRAAQGKNAIDSHCSYLHRWYLALSLKEIVLDILGHVFIK
jgi:hypothetical protein